ncbi:polyribonucleotide nucleotidyltransferase, partial [Candidatus Uhrbacteria bacterium RIFCSPLOWO2_02_FULL_53_10]
MDIKQFKLDWGGKTLAVETGRLAHQADAACTVQIGDTIVLTTVVMSKDVRPGMGFFPLMVDFEEKYAAAGKIKGSRFIKKEGRPSDEAVLTSRMIDRTIRPLFPARLLNEVQIVCNVLSFDAENDADIPAMIGTCIALHMSNIPWNGPVNGVRMGLLDGTWVVNPTYKERERAMADLVVCGTSDKLIMMEAGVNIVPDDSIVEGIAEGLKQLEPLIAFTEQIRLAVGLEKVDPTTESDEARAIREQVETLAKPFITKQVEAHMFSAPLATKTERSLAKSKIYADLSVHLTEQGIAGEHHVHGTSLIYDEVQRYVSEQILKKDRRVDGRGIEDVRAIGADVSFLPRTHGSAIFSRGETQILSTTTLAGPSFEQIVDTMEMDIKKRYMHHYAFPAFSVGETKPNRGPGRREIGHGALAEKALEPVLPSKEDFPYVMRVVSETMGSNGSSSMGSTCGSTLALMDAGVPIKAPVAGVAIGLASSQDMSQWKVITDLQDLEDGPGGMDFKITGTRDGVTAVQLDTKTAGLPMEVVREAFRQAKNGRVKILDVMETTISQPRTELSKYAPRIESLMIHPDKIREVIGPGGKIINAIIDATGVDINIEDDGLVTVTSVDANGIKEAIQWIKNIVAEAEVGATYKGKIVRLMDFGAFAEFLPGKDGLVHISEIAPFRIGKVTDAVKEGDEVFVKVIEIDSMGRVNL